MPVAPICTLLVGMAAPLAMHLAGVELGAGLSISLALVLLVVLNMGPSLRRWRMTGRHRIVPGPTMVQYVVRL